MRFAIATLMLATLPVVPALAQTAPATQEAAPVASEQLKTRLAELVTLFQGKGDYEAYFAPGFRAMVPKAQMDQTITQVVATLGPVTRVESVTVKSPWVAEIVLGFRDGTASGVIGVDATPPHQVSTLRFTGLSGREASIDAVRTTLRALPGSTGFAYARLGDGAPTLIAGDNSERPFALGSGFKLIILAELIRATNAGERKWDDMVTLDGRPLPGGTYTLLPAGTKISLRELASKMISISDNSATDILLHLVGRTRVEAMLRVTGVADPAGMIPFMSTLEMFKLKGIPSMAERYLALDATGRRRMLDGEVTSAPITDISPTLFRDGKPILIDRLEWFATPSDMVRVMDWIRRNTASGAGAEARKILGINPGVGPAVAARWKSVGYKGGSEPGVIHMTMLLEGKDGNWYVVTGSWSNPAAAVEDARFATLIGRAVELAAPPAP
ncbi:serine hydrolase [Sphingomonas sp. AOB5]|uniref:serine hydrolase n=1 Tax=Sphingomonas sp. AOB5 TaxID=3034017 RepID=UPI0023F69014|nr:serine hydrolase [Sphingomonas sp. AOB5]MDF7776666.1 serine hydrolase [Sphingomonas sp. AOB5]